ncbi:MAG: hypothetical protein GY832_26065 [Chloroflexi bacterium]|nr:hypothetical protein [Chloroflexota bacterium]
MNAMEQEQLALDFLGWHQVQVEIGVGPSWRNRDGVAVTMPAPDSDEWAAILKAELRRRGIQYSLDWSPDVSWDSPHDVHMARIVSPERVWGPRSYGETEAAALMLAVAGLPARKRE